MIKKNQPEPLITIIAERSCLRGQSGQSCDRTWEEESGRLAGASLSTGHQVPPVLDDGDGQVVLGSLDVGLEEGKESGLGELLNVPGDVLPLDIDHDVVIEWKMAENSKTYIISLTHVVHLAAVERTCHLTNRNKDMEQCSFVLYCTCTFSDCKSLYIH